MTPNGFRPGKFLALILCVFSVTQFAVAAQKIQIQRLRCEYLENPLGIDAPQPRLSWVIESTVRAQRQTAYQILVASSEKLLRSNKADLWDSGKISSEETAQIAYAGKPLPSQQRCWWKVRIWDAKNKASNWSANT